MIGIGAPPSLVTLTFTREVLDEFPDEVVAAKAEFIDWLGRETPGRSSFISADGHVVFEFAGNDTYHVKSQKLLV